MLPRFEKSIEWPLARRQVLNSEVAGTLHGMAQYRGEFATVA
jgi:predicted phage-related endonuclease